MIPIIQNAVLGSDLDAQNFNINNVATLTPVPSNIVGTVDSRLSDQRVPLDGSVTNAKVAASAAIDQSKLNLNGVIPAAWLGTTSATAATGSLSEYKSNKGIAGGYAGLDGTGKVPAAQMPVGAGLGTVTSVGVAVPGTIYNVTGSPVTGAGTINLALNSQPLNTWFGNLGPGSAPPVFNNVPIPSSMIGSLDASKITTGVFALSLLPVAVGAGTSAGAAGIVPNPGTLGPSVLSTDYLARDMTFKAIPIPPSPLSYQPSIPNLVIAVPPQDGVSTGAGQIYVIPTSVVNQVTFFYSFTGSTGPFSEFTNISIFVQPVTPGPAQVWFYASRVGYNNSAVATYINPNPT
jgi:hypothetical protein